tara:strand:+ start:1152 stop:1331 length:180 start_codon:yes stop_codon:yes gene_type:complete
MARLGESIRTAAANFDKCEALSVHHDEVNFTAAATKISGDWRETLPQQVLERRLFGALT